MKESNQRKVEEQLILFPKKRKEMSSCERVQVYQRKLYLKAKQEKDFRFYILYDKIFLHYILTESWKQVKANGGSAGVDGVTIAQIEQYGVDKFLKELSEDQTACKLVIEPIFEADFEECSYGFRPNRSAQDAIAKIKEHLKTGKTEVYDADLSKYFDTIPHDRLIIALKERIADKRVLKLIEKWLKAPVYEDGQYKGGKKNKIGTPQGGVISPLLSNLYLHLLDRVIDSATSLFRKAGIMLVRYADDFVLMGRKLEKAPLDRLRELLNRMGLTLNDEKSKLIRATELPFNFLGFIFRYDRSFKNPQGEKFWNVKPNERSLTKIRQNIGMALHQMGHFKPEDLVRELNAKIRGWVNYFEIPGVSYPYVAKAKLSYYLRQRLRTYFNRKSQRKSRLYRKQAFELLVTKFGLIDPKQYRPPACL